MKSNAVDLGPVREKDLIAGYIRIPAGWLIDFVGYGLLSEPITEDAEFEIIEPKQLPE